MEHRSNPNTMTLNRAQLRYATAMADILVYIVVLNLFDEYVGAVTIESFSVSVLTALLLWVLLQATSLLEHRVVEHFEDRSGVGAKLLEFGLVFSILFFSKLLILEVVDLVFGGEVELGHFVEVVALIVAMILARMLSDQCLRALGTRSREPAA